MGTFVLGALVITISATMVIVGLAKLLVIAKYGPITRKRG